MRIERDNLHLEIAEFISKRSTCLRANVGAVITRNDRIISTGYNGSISAGQNCNSYCDTNIKCIDAVHAEANAISFAAKEGISLNGTTLFCTHSPCYECSKLIIQCGIIRVVYKNDYSTDNGLGKNLLNSKLVELVKI